MSTSLFPSALLALGFCVATGAVLANPPPPALPPNLLPPGAEAALTINLQNLLSQALGGDVIVKDARAYQEQDGSITMCISGVVRGKAFRLIDANDRLTVHPTKAQWIDGGCTRPNYQYLG